MKKSSILAALLLLVAGLQTAWGQGFRVYKSDGTVAQYSVKSDSIVFYDGIGTDEEFGPFTPVNQMIVGTWYKSKYEPLTFREDGTTDYITGATYEFLPYQGTIVVNNASGMPISILKVHKLTDEMLVLSTLGSSTYDVLMHTRPVQLVTGITLSETSIRLQPDESKRLTASVEPADVVNPAVKWASSDEAVATVVSNGLVVAVAKGTCTIICVATDGSGMKAECTVKVFTDNSGTINGRDYVDLDLPSGTLWATCNVGASKPEEYGDYFAWGETEPKSSYDWSTYKWCNGSYNTMTKYCAYSIYGNNGFTDNLTELVPADDAATANWGSGWQMPSRHQISELSNSSFTTSEWTQLNGVYGLKVTSKSNDNCIFLPAAGQGSNGKDAGRFGSYWQRTLWPLEDFYYNANTGEYYEYYCYDSSYIGDFSSSGWGMMVYNRCDGLSVRPVRVLE